MRYFIYFILVFSFQLTQAQKEATHWYFGINAGLDFSSGVPVPDTNGSLITLEGCASISDAFGSLLFYKTEQLFGTEITISCLTEIPWPEIQPVLNLLS